MKDGRVARALHETPWAILPEKLEAIVDVVRLHAAGANVPMKAAARHRPSSAGGTAVLPLFGVVAQRMDMFMEMSGGTSTERFAEDFRAAMGNDDITTIVLEIDSPGGSVYGVEELASEILAARGSKRIVALVNSLAASAAYWIASAADEIVVTPSGEVGSIGVYALYEDWSKALDEAGIAVSYISAGKYKVEGNETEPLADEARDAIQSRVNDYYGKFVKAVAKGRGVPASEVRGGFGEGRVVGSSEAAKLGMVDRIATMPQTMARLAGRPARRQSSSKARLERHQKFHESTGSGNGPGVEQPTA